MILSFFFSFFQILPMLGNKCFYQFMAISMSYIELSQILHLNKLMDRCDKVFLGTFFLLFCCNVKHNLDFLG